MAAVPTALHTADISQFLTKKAKTFGDQLKAARDYQKRGAFQYLHTMKIDVLKRMIDEKTAGRRKSDETAAKTYSKDLSMMAMIIRRARDLLGLTEDEQKEITQPIYAEAERYQKIYKDKGETGKRPTDHEAIDWEATIEQMKKHNEQTNKIYDLAHPSIYQFNELQRSKFGLLTSHFYNVRANFGELKNFLHPNVDWKKDNVFIYGGEGAAILWNERKADRQSAMSKKRNIKDTQEQELNDSFLQPFVKCPYPEIDCVDPEYVASELIRFVKRFRSDSEYIFENMNGEPFNKVDTLRDNIQKAWHEAVGQNYGSRFLRTSQISHIRNKQRLSTAASNFLAKQNHHNLSENIAYCRDASNS